MAGRADFEHNVALMRRARIKLRPTSALHMRLVVIRVYSLFRHNLVSSQALGPFAVRLQRPNSRHIDSPVAIPGGAGASLTLRWIPPPGNGIHTGSWPCIHRRRPTLNKAQAPVPSRSRLEGSGVATDEGMSVTTRVPPYVSSANQPAVAGPKSPVKEWVVTLPLYNGAELTGRNVTPGCSNQDRWLRRRRRRSRSRGRPQTRTDSEKYVT